MKKMILKLSAVIMFFIVLCLLNFLICMNMAHAQVPACPQNMTSYWMLDETTGTTFTDSVSGKNAGCTGSACPGFTSGRIGNALLFDGIDDGINVSADASFNWSSTDSFSIEFWMKTDPSSTCAGNQVIVGRDGGTTPLQWWVGCLDGGKAAFFLKDKSGDSAFLNGTTDLTDGSWHNIVALRDAGLNEVRIYVDGIEESSVLKAYTDGFDSTNDLNIGWLNLDAGYHFNGIIDEVALYNRALSDVEIRSHYYLVRGYCDMCSTPVRIMPAGDSITEGCCNGQVASTDYDHMASYRQKLYLDLTDMGYYVDFVGSLKTGLLLTPPFDIDNEGQPGWTASCPSGAGQMDNEIYNLLSANPPEVVLLHIGTNDVALGCGDVNGVASILDEIDRYSKDITVVLARIINQKIPIQAVTDFNNAVQAMAQTRIANGDKIIIVDEEHALTYPDDMNTTLHPTQTGYNKMAGPWFNALNNFLPVCGEIPPSITSTAVTEAFIGWPYIYNVHAVGNPQPAYSLNTYPQGMTIAPSSGLIEWLPDTTDAFSVEVQATNTAGFATQSFLIQVAGAPICPSHMIHYWKLEGISSPYRDYIGNNDAACTNCPIPTTGIVNSAQQFNLTNQVNVADDNTFDWASTDSFSIEFWMKTDIASSCVGNQVIVGRDGGTTPLHWWVGCLDGGKAAFFLKDNSGESVYLNGTTGLNDGFWHHIVALRDAGLNEVRIYVNGIKEASALKAYTSGFDSATDLNIGWLNISGGHHFTGAIDEVALYNRALSDAEIQQHYTHGTNDRGYCSAGYIITASASGGNGTVSCTSPVSQGDASTCTIAANTGFHLSDLTDNGSNVMNAVTGNNPYAYAITNVTANHTVAATFSINTYAITTEAGPNGSITCSPNPVNHGSDSICTVAPTGGYHVESVTVDGSPATLSNGAYTFSGVTETHTIAATFAINTYAITATVTGGNGTISCEPSVSYGGGFTCTMSPNAGYYLQNLTDNASDVTSLVSNNLYSVSNVTSDHTIAATFSSNPPIKMISGSTITYYFTLQSAYNAATSGDTIQSQALTFNEDRNFNLNKSVIFNGGFDSTFSSQPGYTTVHGSVTISDGTVTVENIVIQ